MISITLHWLYVYCVHSYANVRYGEVVDVNLVRDKATGKSKGFAFLAYEDQRSTILAVGVLFVSLFTLCIYCHSLANDSYKFCVYFILQII